MKKFVFDLDNTLVYTDSLNNESYNYALNELGMAPINDCKRITRSVIFNKFPNLSHLQKRQILEWKQRYFIHHLHKTVPNTSLIHVLKTYDVQSCLLWTSAHKSRVLPILEHYHIRNEFKTILFSNKVHVAQDVEKICELLQCGYKDITVYEDNVRVIRELQLLEIQVIPMEIVIKVQG